MAGWSCFGADRFAPSRPYRSLAQLRHDVISESAPTAGIAKAAGVANGSLFTYFETKADLFNQLYLELKGEMAFAAMKGFPAGAELREQVFHVRQNWMTWAVSFPEKRRALAELGVSDEIMPTTRAVAHKTMAGVAELLERSRVKGPIGKFLLKSRTLGRSVIYTRRKLLPAPPPL